MERWTNLGVDIADVAYSLSSIHQYHNTLSQATELNSGIIQVAEESREYYLGPIMHCAHFKSMFFPNTSILEAPFWSYFDIISLSGWGIDLTGHSSTTLLQLIDGWKK